MNTNVFYVYILLIAVTAIILILVNRYFYNREMEEPEIYDAILNIEELEKHASDIARNHVIDKRMRQKLSLENRMNRNFKYITTVYKSLNEYVNEMKQVTPASEWLLDNFYIIEEQVKEIRQNLSKQYYNQLPRLKNGWLRGYPRVYAIALELISHTDGRMDDKSLLNFIRSYQTQALLSSGELWAIPLMVRMALIENIRYVCDKIIQSQQQWLKAEKLANILLNQKDKTPEDLVHLLYEQMKHEELISSSFCEHLLNRLKKQGLEIAPIIYYLDERLSEQHTNGADITQLEHNEQARRQVSMGNAITSLRLISSLDWREIFESLSQVELILRQDPALVYSKMDFPSRDYYRHSVEKISKKYKFSEIQIAKKAIECAQEQEKHVGYFLLGRNKKELIEKLGYSETQPASKLFIYMTVVLLTTLGMILPFILYSISMGVGSIIGLILIGLSILVPVLDITIVLTNWIITQLVPTAFLPKMELLEGIPEEAKTIVVIPTLLPNAKRASALIEQLESYYLANKEKNLYFALLGDFKDAAEEKMPEDNGILEAVVKGIKALNRQYAKNGDVFFVFHRKRIYNEKQNKWMGWERKRGALVEFNELLKKSSKTSFMVTEGNNAQLEGIKYVITIDADTKLPMDAAKKMIGAMMHPLNEAVVDQEKGIVTEGYGLLQPRISVDIMSANASFFSRVFAGQGGIDIYTTAVSDVYQDFFGEGIFTGKGIYHLDVFHQVLHNTIPDNRVLSHDLLEGSYLRTGLVTDIELIDGYPARYNAFSMRLHRWVRGDWQTIHWLFGHIINREGQRIKNPLGFDKKWKIIDNLRRSLSAPAALLLIMLAICVLPGNPLFWLGLAGISVAFQIIVCAINILVEKCVNLHTQGFGENTPQNAAGHLKIAFLQVFFQFTFLPYQAYLMLNAITKTLIRVYITKRNFLEWVTAADMETGLKNDAKSFLRRMWICPLMGLIAVGLSIVFEPRTLIFSLFLLLDWGTAPFIAYQISKTQKTKENQLNQDEMVLLRKTARKTWSFFEDFVSAMDNYLPPDNYQESPPNGIAHRTSPTNIGLLLISILSARDLGYISTSEMLFKLDQSLKTIEKLSKWKGHLYNWYDTITLEVLRPHYISTVDSGNFIAYLITLKQGLLYYMKRPLVDKNLVMGLKDTVLLANEENPSVKIETALFDELMAAEAIDMTKWKALLDTLTEKNSFKKPKWGYKLHRMTLTHQKEYDALIRASKNSLSEMFEGLIERIEKLIDVMQFAPLYNSKRKLFSIGYNEDEGQLTKSYYDLLASEARQASFIAIARGEIKKEHWFMLDRTLTSLEGSKGLVSWTGTMFEYLMPLIIMKNYDHTLLNETYQFVLLCQKEYGRKRQVPWGVSESGYFSFDFRLNYQYKAFGIPSLGLKRGLINDTVIAPYSTLLALMVSPKEAVKNMRSLINAGLDSDYGFYEAIDYTPERQTKNNKSSVVRSFMAHHQGMGFVALNNIVNDNIIQGHFHNDPFMKSAELLLQEKIPTRVIFAKDYKEKIEPFKEMEKDETEYITALDFDGKALPEAYILSNGSYSVMLTDKGCGYSKYRDLAVTRWREDTIEAKSGTFCYIQDVENNEVWSTAIVPVKKIPDKYKVIFSQDKVVYIRTDGSVDTQTEIIVSPEDDVEIRRITMTNHGAEAKVLEITSYMEVVLNSHASDVVHPSFSNLFVKTDYLSKYNCLMAERRPRETGKSPVWAIHSVLLNEEVLGGIQYETDRSKFIGRTQNLHNPVALEGNYPLSNSIGAVLDPIMSLRVRIKIQAGQTIKISYITGVAEKKETIIGLAEKYHEQSTVDRAFEMAWTRSQVELRYLNLTRDEIECYRQMIAQIIFLSPLRRMNEALIKKNIKGQQGLWAYGISGDIPIVLITITKGDEIDLVKDVLKAHEYWRMKGLIVDIVIIDEAPGSYTQPLFNLLQDIVSISHARDIREKSGGVFIRQGSNMPEEDKILLGTVARVVLSGKNGSLATQIKYKESKIASTIKLWNKRPQKYEIENIVMQELLYFNGYGGFNQDGSEYIIRLTDNLNTPAPWINVISNKAFGFQISESGASYTWAENSRENKLTVWSNDPIIDPSGEIIYLRDDETGELWTITPQPIRRTEPYIIHHGFGYSHFEHSSHGIRQSMKVFVPLEDGIKFNVIRLQNTTDQARQLTLTYYVRPVLGVSDQFTSPFIVTEMDESGLLLIKNSYNEDFTGRIAFMDVSEKERCFTGDRREFLGYSGLVSSPEGLKKEKLSGTVGAGLDPCACLQIKVQLNANEGKDIIFSFGQGTNIDEVRALAAKYRNNAAVDEALNAVTTFWRRELNCVKVKTPDTSMDILLNGWLLYQTVVCRLWARTAFYQSGGAYGYRDQLQDVMVLSFIAPEETRKQIIYHAAHQFYEGDVQHWWHPVTNKGIRTRFSDDLLWLPYVSIDYINNTEDWSILKEQITYLDDACLQDEEDERYSRPCVYEKRESIYEHCIKAIEHSLKFGQRGIPLMGSGDWNDGMSTVGNKGKGESVWMGWFLYDILTRFIPICRYQKDDNRAERYANIAKELAKSMEDNAWDGNWYRRAYFDNGVPLGSADNTECKIDSLSQSWAVISGAAKQERIEQGFAAVEHYLIKRDEGLALLLTPPFDEGDLEPGYIKSYLPGVRENGGQYTHAATWVVMAYAQMGQGDKAWELFHMLNPINHASTNMEAARYKVEPYVMAADVYAVHPHIGRGGWTWYTGASGWMYRVGLQQILGLNKKGSSLTINPCVPRNWPEFEIVYQYGNTSYRINVKNPARVNQGIKEIYADGVLLKDNNIALADDGLEHAVEVTMG